MTFLPHTPRLGFRAAWLWRRLGLGGELNKPRVLRLINDCHDLACVALVRDDPDSVVRQMRMIRDLTFVLRKLDTAAMRA